MTLILRVRAVMDWELVVRAAFDSSRGVCAGFTDAKLRLLTEAIEEQGAIVEDVRDFASLQFMWAGVVSSARHRGVALKLGHAVALWTAITEVAITASFFHSSGR